MTTKYDKEGVLKILNQVLELELAGVVRYTHYSFMVFGHNRLPIVKWFRDQAGESLSHAETAGEMITTLGEHPSLKIGPLLETHKHDIDSILRESLEEERKALALYHALLELVEGKGVLLEDYARKMVSAEETHAAEVDKMLRKPGDIKKAAS